MTSTNGNNKPIGITDQKQRHIVYEDRVGDEIGARVPLPCHVVNAACSQISLRHITAPADERHNCPECCHEPDKEYFHYSQLNGHRCPIDTLHNHIVTIESDHAHGPNGNAAKH